MSGFEDDFGEMVEGSGKEESQQENLLQDDNEEDPAAEFLVREQEQISGIDEELGAVLSASTTAISGSRSSSRGVQETVAAKVKQEPAVLREWREKQMERLREKDEKEEEDKENLKLQASKELEEWYKQLDDSLEKTRAANREARLSVDRSYVSEVVTLEPGTEWERVSKLCDFNQKTSKNIKDVSRMRSIILQLKQQSTAPQ